MERENLPSLIGAAIGDMLAAFSINGSAITGLAAQTAIGSYLKRRFEQARDILIDEFRKAKIDKLNVESEDELGGVLFRYFSAIRENKARLNLRLMAKVMAGQATRDRLYTEDFFRYADILSMLSRAEVLAIMLLHKTKLEGDFVNCEELWRVLVTVAVPKYFLTDEHLRAALTSAMRSGLVITPPTFDDAGFFTTSPLVEEIADLADFEDALRQESGVG
ncbi:MAG: hypothetical protein ACK4FJ_00715 [Ferrovibrio sp.]|uniref:hypothetical protein n=1 Tax=Ferrovibrio sp. TaxID=1917215 RepID=UPI00391A4E74